MNILIKEGTIIDGTGAPRFKADVLIKGNIIQEIGEDLNDQNCEIIDAQGMIVAPGFIDMHNHADLTIIAANTADAYLRQGVTTLVVGMCGIGFAPANEKVRKYYDVFITKIFGSKEMRLYDSLKEYMDIIRKKGISPNLVFFIPHGNVRAMILGVEERVPNPDEITQMQEIVKEGMEAGAFGLSTGLIYPPGSVSKTEEIIELCKIVSNYNGLYDSHMRNEGAGVISEGMNELIRIARDANIDAHISHWKAGSNFAWKLTPLMIETVKNARNQGLNITADMYPYEEGSTSLSGAILRPWVYEDFTHNLTDPEIRKKIVEQTIDMFFETFLSDLPGYLKIIPRSIMTRLMFFVAKKIVRIISVIHNHEVEGLKLGEALAILYPKQKFTDALLDFIRDEEGSIMISMKSMSEGKSILQLISQDFVCIGSDGFLITEGNTHPRSYGTFPKILGNYVRQKNLFSLEEAVRKMTGLPTSILGLKDRGLINPNYKADITIFNPETVIDTSTYEKGTQFPIGVEHVIVNGEITVKNGENLGVLKGEIILKRGDNL